MLSIQPSARSEMITSTVVSPVPSTTMLSPWPGSRCSKGCHGYPSRPDARLQVSDPGSAAGGSLPVAKTTRSASTAVESVRRTTAVSPAGSMSKTSPATNSVVIGVMPPALCR